ncbi:MAG: uracil-DNA glycosylase [Planctomycetes bacterium]|nr:uracil-DNA glycosylase [Planctomycetota bacterium]
MCGVGGQIRARALRRARAPAGHVRRRAGPAGGRARDRGRCGMSGQEASRLAGSLASRIRAAAAMGLRRLPGGRRASERGTAGAEAACGGTDAAGASEALERLAEGIRACRRCPLGAQRLNAVPGEGSPGAEILFVGEAPGYDEDRQGRPFVGKAGQLLDRMIAAMGMRRQDVFIANVLKCHPPRNRDPNEDEIRSCRPWLEAQLREIRPQVIIALGAHATRTLLRSGGAISALRGRFQELDGIPVMPTFHPAYLLRNPEEKRKAWEDLKAVLRRLGRPIPGSRRPESGGHR